MTRDQFSTRSDYTPFDGMSPCIREQVRIAQENRSKRIAAEAKAAKSLKIVVAVIVGIVLCAVSSLAFCII